MKLLIALVAVLVFASPAAGSTPRVKRLEIRLHNMSIVRKREKSAYQQQIESLQAQLAQTQAQLAAAQQHATSLQNQINSIPSPPSPFSVAVTQVREAATWAGGGGQATAEAAMDYTIGHVSLGVYGYLEDQHLPLPPTTEGVGAILSGGAGYCGHSSRVFGALMVALGYQVRGVWFTYDDPLPDGHYAVEVYYDGDWHFFDPTFGKFWLDTNGVVESIDTVRLNGGTLVKDDAALTNLVEDPKGPGGNYSWFETDATVPIEYQPQSNFVS